MASRQPHNAQQDIKLHALKDNRLQALMLKINTLAYEQEKTRLDSEIELGQKAPQIILTAKELTNAVKQIKESRAIDMLSAKDKNVFITLADKLLMNAKELEAAAIKAEPFGMVRAYAQMQTTCGSCHTLFRGELP